MLGYTLVREIVVPATVTTRRQGDAVVAAISGFNSGTTRDLRRALEHALSADRPAKAIVLDLRGNPGGLLRQAIDVADLFLADGGIVATDGRHPASHQRYEAGAKVIAPSLPLAVVVDGKSASSAEVLAAALQDRGRAVVVGTASYGKGTVQTVFPLPNGGEILITWSRLRPPSGYILHGLGVLPTVCTSDHAPATVRNDSAHLESTAEGARRRLAAWRTPARHDRVERRRLRSSCPPERHQTVADIDLARRILSDRPLYARLSTAPLSGAQTAASPGGGFSGADGSAQRDP
jgi:carboxyl-terminal processing protease